MSKDKDNYQNLFGTGIVNLNNDIANDISEKRFINRVKIGEGGQATVYKVFDSHLNIYRAMKIIHSQFSSNKEFVQNYKNEVNITSQLNYPNIVKVYDADIEKNELFIIMDYIDGKELSMFDRLPEVIAALIICRVLDALSYAHNAHLSFEGQSITGIIHGDLKPENLIINKDGEVMIMDFGLAKAARNINYSSSSITLGTFAYAPPELFENEETTVQSDIYSLGVTMYKLLSGITGYENDTQISILNKKNKDYCDTVNQNSIDSNLFNIICKATRKSKNERYNNAREMQDELEKYINKYYEIDNSYKNILGAYFNFHILPKKKEIEPVEIELKSKPKINVKKILGITAIPILLIFLYFVGTKVVLPNMQGNKNDGNISEEVSNVAKKDISEEESTGGNSSKDETSKSKKTTENKVITDHHESWNPKNENNVANDRRDNNRKSAKKTIKKSFKRLFTIKNPQQIKGDVYLDGSIVGRLDKYGFSYNIKKSGKYKVTIKADNVNDFTKRIEFGDFDDNFEIYYDPIIYSVSINNPEHSSAKVYINGESIGKLPRTESLVKYFSNPGNIKVEIVNDEEGFVDFIKRISISEENPSAELNYIPIKEESYMVSIENKNNINAKVSINNSEEEDLGAIFQKSYPDRHNLKIVIVAEGYEDKTYNVEFTDSKTFEITYDPIRTHADLIIKNCPENAKIFVDGTELDIKGKREVVIPQLQIGREYTIKIIKGNYAEFVKSVLINENSNSIMYAATLNVGKIVFDPPLRNDSMKNLTLSLDDKKISIANEISDIPLGIHTITLFYKNKDYSWTKSKKVNILPIKENDANSPITKIEMNYVQIKSTERNTKIYVDDKYAGMADLVVPFFNSTINVIRAEIDGGIPKVKRINPKTNSKVVFNNPNPKAEKLFIEADELLTDYRSQEYKEQYQDMLREADSKFEQALAIDPSYSEAYSKKIFIITEKFGYAIDNNNQDLADGLIERLEDLQESAEQYLESNLDLAIMYKNIGKCYFLYAQTFLSENQKAPYIEKNSLKYLKLSFNTQLKIADTSGIKFPESYDLDESKCLLAKTYQILYNLTKKNSYKSLALRIWRGSYFNDYSLGRNNIQKNPFRLEKKEWISKL